MFVYIASIFVALLVALVYRIWKLHLAQVAMVEKVRFSRGNSQPGVRRVAVVGAGPGGISSAYFLSREGIEPFVLECEDHIGGVWGRLLYASLRANVVKEEMTLSGMDDYPEGTGRYPSKSEVLGYLKAYVKRFDLERFIRLSCRVTGVAKRGTQWEVFWNDADGRSCSDLFDGLVVATGQTGVPLNPCNEYKGFEEHFRGSSIHSGDYRDPLPYLNKKALVVGVGSASGVDISQQISSVAEKTHVSIGRPRMIVKPGDGLMAWGWDTRLDLYLPFRRKYFMGGQAYMLVEWLRYGSKASFEKATGIIRPDIVTPNPLNVSTDPQDFVRRCFTGSITVQRRIAQFEKGNVVVFDDGRKAEIDAIVWATGYMRNFQQWSSLLLPDSDGCVQLFEFLFLPSDDSSVAFVCEQHPLGPHWRVIAAQTELIAKVFAGELSLPAGSVRKREAKK